MKHPHPGEIREVYRQLPDGKYKYVGYTVGPFTEHPEYSHSQYKDAKWNDEMKAWVMPVRTRTVI